MPPTEKDKLSRVLIADQNSHIFERKENIALAAKHGFEIVCVGRQSSGLINKTPDPIIYAHAVEHKMIVITKDDDFLDIARDAYAKNPEKTTEVFLN
ncbi:MAG: DUF5615 family PIN-like protein [Oligoflexus sp.]|nr:DUF5615 family PIN-like protein [Oligoflexus sp.]